ncbi:HK97 family phage prohead protease [Kitasatospora sp. NPDC101235]|uniref:HK97 family phage prohead protease n=1 Tax=Kitasatospora sp. NPDC101235 TaxID=3364101 RepID=UPI0038290FAF
MKVKQARAVIKAAEQEGSQGRVTALVSVFGNEDSVGDVVMPGAFTKTLADWASTGDTIPVLWSHRMDDPNMVVGHVVKAMETTEGLQIEAQLDLDSANGAQVYRLLKGRRIKNWSFAYDIEAGGYGEMDGRPVYELRQLKLHEVSPCIVGANQETRTDEVKSSPVDGYRAAVKRYEAAVRAQAEVVDPVDASIAGGVALKARARMFEARKQALDEGATEEELEQNMAKTDEIAELRAQLEALQAQMKTPVSGTREQKTQHVPLGSQGAHDRAAVTSSRSADAEMKKALTEFGNSIGVGVASKEGQHLDPRVKAAGGSTWAATVIKRSTDQFGQFKGLLAAGTVPVTVPLDPEPVRADVPVLSVRQLIPLASNTGPRFSYLRQTVRTNNAAVVAPGAKKPTSTYTLARVDDRVRTIAHLSEPINKFDLEDAPALRQFLDQEMRLGLELGLESEIVNGDGTGEHMTGISNVSGSQVQAFDTDILRTARKAVTKLEKVGHLVGAGWLMHPDDWEAFELLQDNEARFYYGGPGNAVNPASRRLWGAPVVTSLSATVGTTHLVDWQAATRLHVLEDGTLDWSENMYDKDALGTGVGASDFERNMIRFRFEGRFGLEILRPSAIVEVDLTP